MENLYDSMIVGAFKLRSRPERYQKVMKILNQDQFVRKEAADRWINLTKRIENSAKTSTKLFMTTKTSKNSMYWKGKLWKWHSMRDNCIG